MEVVVVVVKGFLRGWRYRDPDTHSLCKEDVVLAVKTSKSGAAQGKGDGDVGLRWQHDS